MQRERRDTGNIGDYRLRREEVNRLLKPFEEVTIVDKRKLRVGSAYFEVVGPLGKPHLVVEKGKVVAHSFFGKALALKAGIGKQYRQEVMAEVEKHSRQIGHLLFTSPDQPGKVFHAAHYNEVAGFLDSLPPYLRWHVNLSLAKSIPHKDNSTMRVLLNRYHRSITGAEIHIATVEINGQKHVSLFEEFNPPARRTSGDLPVEPQFGSVLWDIKENGVKPELEAVLLKLGVSHLYLLRGDLREVAPVKIPLDRRFTPPPQSA